MAWSPSRRVTTWLPTVLLVLLHTDAYGGCLRQGFESYGFGPLWRDVFVGTPLAYSVSGGSLRITDAPFAATPSAPNYSWIYDADSDLGNQVGWATPIEDHDFKLTFDFDWETSTAGLTLAGVGLTDATHHFEVLAGLRDGWSLGLGHPFATVRRPGPDLDWYGPEQGTGGGRFVITRTAGSLSVSFNGSAVLNAVSTAQIHYLAIFAVRHRDPAGEYTFDSFGLDALALCTPPPVSSPVGGRLRQVAKGEPCDQTQVWCFRQGSDTHVPGGGIGGADDTLAWDANFGPDEESDNGLPVYAVASGSVPLCYADKCNAFVNACPNVQIETCTTGQVLIEHQDVLGQWWSGYLHLDPIMVRPGDGIYENTLIGFISNKRSPNRDPVPPHLHFVVYEGENREGGLESENVIITERQDIDGDFVPDDADSCLGTDPPEPDADGDGCGDSLAGLVTFVERLRLPAPIAGPLRAMALNAAAAYEDGHTRAAAYMLGAFVKLVENSAQHLTNGQILLLQRYVANVRVLFDL